MREIPKFAILAASFFAGLCAIPMVVLVMAASGRLSVDGVSEPPQWEERLGQTALEASLARRAQRLKNPTSGSDAELLAGMKYYKMNCAGCHGDYSGPSPWGSKNFYPRVPQFAQHVPKFTAAEMFVVIKYGIRYSGMGGWNGMMSDGQIWHIATFLSRLDSLPLSVDRVWKTKR